MNSQLRNRLQSARSSPSKHANTENSLVMRIRDLDEMAGDVSKPADVRRISAALAAAVNDWPTQNLESVEAFVSELENEIGMLSKFNVRQKLKCYTPATDAWKGESLTALLAAWGNDNDDVLLHELIKRIMQQ